MEQARLERWHKISGFAIDADEVKALRAALADLIAAPSDAKRAHLRTLAQRSDLTLLLPPLLMAALATRHPADLAAILKEELAKATPTDAIDEAFAQYLAGEWRKAAALLEQDAASADANTALILLRTAGRLYRNVGENEKALAAYRAVVMKKPADMESLRTLGTIINTPAIDPFVMPKRELTPSDAIARIEKRESTPPANKPITTPINMPSTKTPTMPLRGRAQTPPRGVRRLQGLTDEELDERFSAVFANEPVPQTIPPDTTMRIAPERPSVTSIIDSAKAFASSGDVESAEQKLRALVAQQPREVSAHLALVDLLRANKRIGEADEYLRVALTLPLDRPARASLLHRRALVTMSLGGDDGIVRAMLRDAHELDPDSLSISLAYGESCFANEEWEAAAKCLGGLADHPNAASRLQHVTRGLVHAAMAELRLYSPERATHRCHAALRLDPTYAPAKQTLEMIESTALSPWS